MSIFGIIAISLLIALLGLSIIFLVWEWLDRYSDKRFYIMAICIPLVIFLVSIFAGIGIVTEYEKQYVAKYEIQKETIERSLESDILSGWERAELVNKAVELNGELAERKFKFNKWHYVFYDNSIYDNVDFITFDDEVKTE